jgi:hypothetical protein
MTNRINHSTFIFLIYIISPFACFAQLPLITDNTGTQGKGKGQLEISNGVGFHNEHRCIENSSEISPVFTYGINDKIDIVLCYPFLYSTTTADSSITKMAGFSDLSLELKYRFYKGEHLSFAVKPGISFPTGSYNEGLGSGRLSGTLFFITSLELPTVCFNGNLGYLRNENRCGDALNIWHASLDIDKKLSKEFHFVLNTGIEKNPNPDDNRIPVFGLLGLYYCLNENCEISLGYEHDFIKEETNHSFIYGLTLRF